MKIETQSLQGEALLIITGPSGQYQTEQIPANSLIKDINEFVCNLYGFTGEQLLQSNLKLTVFNP